MPPLLFSIAGFKKSAKNLQNVLILNTSFFSFHFMKNWFCDFLETLLREGKIGEI